MIPRISVPVQKNPSMLLGPGNAGGRGDHSFEPEEIEIDSFLLEEARRPPEVFDRYAGMGAPEQPQVLGVYIAIEVHGPRTRVLATQQDDGASSRHAGEKRLNDATARCGVQRQHGSVRGAASNRCPYRDRGDSAAG